MFENAEKMTTEEFMSKSLLEIALKNKNKDYFNFILKGQIFDGTETNYDHYKKQSSPAIGTSCKLYFDCKICKENKRYSEYFNLVKLRTKGKRVCKECQMEKNEANLLAMKGGENTNDNYTGDENCK